MLLKFTYIVFFLWFFWCCSVCCCFVFICLTPEPIGGVGFQINTNRQALQDTLRVRFPYESTFDMAVHLKKYGACCSIIFLGWWDDVACNDLLGEHLILFIGLWTGQATESGYRLCLDTDNVFQYLPIFTQKIKFLIPQEEQQHH